MAAQAAAEGLPGVARVSSGDLVAWLFPSPPVPLVMGGGGGAGTSNDGAYWVTTTDTGNDDCGANCTGIFSSGVAGGGILIFMPARSPAPARSPRMARVRSTENDGGGGGGAGGTILAVANSGGVAGLTASAVGGNGGVTWPSETAGTPFPGNRHGPGGAAEAE